MVDLIAAPRQSVAQARGRKKESAGTEKMGFRPRRGHKSDLAAMARELDITGRSTMMRDELERAVTKASDTTSARSGRTTS